MAEDYYSILGVSKGAGEREIKKSYRKLAMKHHPDRGGDEEAFKKISEAYAVLSDPQKKQNYDQFGDAGFHQRYSYEDIFRGADFNDIFREMGFNFGGSQSRGSIFDLFTGGFGGFGRRGRRMERGADLEVVLELSLEDAAKGGEKRMKIQHLVKCSKCNGTGAKKGTGKKTCPKCHGSGQIRHTRNFGGMRFVTSTVCDKCRGAGKIIEDPCPECEGSGKERKTESIEVSVPKGIFTGATLRLQGEGNYARDASGDLYVHTRVKEHNKFKREEDDLWLDYPISFGQAVLGSKLKVPLLLGGDHTINISAGTQTHEVFTIKGEGMPKVRGRGNGDLKVRVIVQIPKKLSKKEKELIKELEGIEDKNLLDKIFG
ncbi:MAG: molecular chaperone DnaJ [Candidatus Auribacterota bacterium]|nr:molecular chaperone DnaJ [Candidatus Auribacterota bacterium]